MAQTKGITVREAATFASRLLLHAGLLLGGFHAGASTQPTAQIALAWNVSQDTNVAGYAIYYGSSSGNYTNWVDIGTNTAGQVTGLAPGTTYYFAVKAYNSGGVTSPPSNEVVFTAPPALQLGLAANGTTATLGFQAVAGHSYQLQASPNLRNWTNVWQSAVASSNGWQTCQDTVQGSRPTARYYRLLVN